MLFNDSVSRDEFFPPRCFEALGESVDVQSRDRHIIPDYVPRPTAPMGGRVFDTPGARALCGLKRSTEAFARRPPTRGLIDEVEYLTA